ncbi:hypothetical protein K438DRAFT_1840821, partial [Mycena galopus ATCC 62051]
AVLGVYVTATVAFIRLSVVRAPCTRVLHVPAPVARAALVLAVAVRFVVAAAMAEERIPAATSLADVDIRASCRYVVGPHIRAGDVRRLLLPRRCYEGERAV